MTADIIRLASRYGRYGYRRITAMLRSEGWTVNAKRVERIWRREGLKVPQKQPKRGRLWLNDGSCIRLRPEYPGHVWSYDFVEGRTHDGSKFRILTIIDESTRECLAIRIDRKLNSTDVIDALVGPVHPARPARPYSVGQWRRSLSPRPSRNGSQPDRREDALHRAGHPMGERLQRELQRERFATNCSTARSSTASPRPRC